MTYSVVEYQPNEFIFKQGDPGDLMYLVQAGEVEVLQDLGGHENQVAVLERGDFFGEMAVLEEEPRTHSVRALSDAKLIKIDRAGFQKMLVRNAEIAVRMIRKLSLRLLSAEDMLMRVWTGADSAAAEAPVRVRGLAKLAAVTDGTELALPDQAKVSIGRVDPINQIHPDVDLTGIDMRAFCAVQMASSSKRNGRPTVRSSTASASRPSARWRSAPATTSCSAPCACGFWSTTARAAAPEIVPEVPASAIQTPADPV